MSNEANRPLRLGTRGSALALWQANWVKAEIERLTATPVELVLIKTTGDRIVDTPLAKIGGKGLFTKELDEALLDSRIDLAAHSLKDVPFALPDGLVIAAIPPREVPWDAFISNGPKLRELPSGATIGTGSLRRGIQLQRRFPALRVVPMRGNVDTRLRRLDANEFDGIILAAAGLRRLGYAARIVETLDEHTMLPAIGQGALAVVCRTGDADVLERLKLLEDSETRLAVTAERALLLALEGSCQIPIAALARLSGTQMRIRSLIANPSGSALIEDEIESAVDQSVDRAFALGTALAESMMRKGADRILDESVAMPLHGKTILTTRAGAGAGDLGSRLRALGAKVIECPAIEIAPVEDWHEVDRAIATIDSFQWLLFTSANAVNAFMERARTLQTAIRIPIAAVGPATAASLERWKIHARLVPADFRAEGLLAEFPDRMQGTRILFPRAEVARELLPDELRRRGAVVDVVVVYRTVRGSGIEDVRAILAREPVDCIVFTSSSTVRFFAEALGEDTRLLDSLALAVIGPVTRSAAEGLGLKATIEPARATATDLAEAINAYFETRH